MYTADAPGGKIARYTLFAINDESLPLTANIVSKFGEMCLTQPHHQHKEFV